MRDVKELTDDGGLDAPPDMVEEPPAHASPGCLGPDAASPQPSEVTRAAVRARLAEQRLDVATQLILDWLDQQVADGDEALAAVRLLLRHYATIVSQLAPLAHLGCAPLRPDDRLHECFFQFVELLHRQDGQIRELQEIIAELV